MIFSPFHVEWTIMHSWLKKVTNGYSGSDSEETYWSNTTLSKRAKVSQLYFVARFDCNLNQMNIFSSCWSVLLCEFNKKWKIHKKSKSQILYICSTVSSNTMSMMNKIAWLLKKKVLTYFCNLFHVSALKRNPKLIRWVT